MSRSIRVPPDITSVLSELAGQTTGADTARRVPVNELIGNLGIALDPSTRVSLSASGLLDLNTSSTVDADAISALIQSLNSQKPLQHKFTSAILDLAADMDWTPPDTSQMTEAELQSFMREMAQKKGTVLRTMPSMTARGGQSGAIEITREWVVPTDDSEEVFETHHVGQVMQIEGSPLGFGHDLAINFTDTTADVDPDTGKPTFTKRIDVKDAGFSSDSGTRFIVQTRPDGSRAIVLVTSTLIDATGRPIRDVD